MAGIVMGSETGWLLGIFRKGQLGPWKSRLCRSEIALLLYLGLGKTELNFAEGSRKRQGWHDLIWASLYPGAWQPLYYLQVSGAAVKSSTLDSRYSSVKTSTECTSGTSQSSSCMGGGVESICPRITTLLCSAGIREGMRSNIWSLGRKRQMESSAKSNVFLWFQQKDPRNTEAFVLMTQAEEAGGRRKETKKFYGRGEHTCLGRTAVRASSMAGCTCWGRVRVFSGVTINFHTCPGVEKRQGLAAPHSETVSFREKSWPGSIQHLETQAVLGK